LVFLQQGGRKKKKKREREKRGKKKIVKFLTRTLNPGGGEAIWGL